MTENSEPEPDVPTQLRVVGKKSLRYLEKTLDSAIQDVEQDMKEDRELDQDIEQITPVRRARKPLAKKTVANPPPQNLGIRGWLKGPKKDEKK
jgi:hypothetical protein